MFILLGSIAKYVNPPMSFLIFLSVLTSVIAFYSMCKWSPRPIIPASVAKAKMLKCLSMGIVAVWSMLDSYFIFSGNKPLIFFGCLGLLVASFIITPVGYIFFDYIGHAKRKKPTGISFFK
jgi:hypothetical protein